MPGGHSGGPTPELFLLLRPTLRSRAGGIKETHGVFLSKSNGLAGD